MCFHFCSDIKTESKPVLLFPLYCKKALIKKNSKLIRIVHYHPKVHGFAKQNMLLLTLFLATLVSVYLEALLFDFVLQPVLYFLLIHIQFVDPV